VATPAANQCRPSDLICVGTDWSASQGDSDAAAAANSAIPRLCSLAGIQLPTGGHSNCDRAETVRLFARTPMLDYIAGNR
jgi:hypothetical protein